ncbi:MAG: oligosaccharide flippase family protein, partial [Bacteroidales bacterium]|nr:oligosaccharide flippase family protein [Bacteroidales bacterium]
MISKKFIKSSFIYSFIGALPLASSIILLPFYTNYLSTSDFGIFSLFLGFTALVQILVNLTIDQYLVYSYYDSKDNFQKVKEIVGTSVAILLVWGAFVSLIFYLFGSSIFDLYNTYLTKETKEIKFFPYGFFCVLTAVFNSLFQSYKGLLIAQQKPIQYFWFNISNFFLTVGISLGGLFLYPYTLVGPMYGRLLSGVAIFILALLSFIINFGLTFQKKLLKNIYKFCFPLFFNSNVIWVIGYLGVFIINYYTCSSDVAI